MSNDIHERLRTLNPAAEIQDATEIRSPMDLSGGTLGHSDFPPFTHRSDYRSAVMKTDKILAADDLMGMLQLMVNRLGSGLLRIKGLARIEESEFLWALQVSGQIVHEPSVVRSENPLPAHTQLVVITKDTDPALAVSIFDAFVGNVSQDTPDKQALQNNPLTIPGM